MDLQISVSSNSYKQTNSMVFQLMMKPSQYGISFINKETTKEKYQSYVPLLSRGRLYFFAYGSA